MKGACQTVILYSRWFGLDHSGKWRSFHHRAHFKVWSCRSLETKVVLGMGECEFAVSAVAFSSLNGGAWVMALEESKEAVLTVWDWENKVKQEILT